MPSVHYVDLEQRPAGTHISVTHIGGSAYVEVVNAVNFISLQADKDYGCVHSQQLSNGWFTFTIPVDDHWYVVAVGDGELQVDLIPSVQLPGIPMLPVVGKSGGFNLPFDPTPRHNAPAPPSSPPSDRRPAPAQAVDGQTRQQETLAEIQRMNDQAVVERAPRVANAKKELDAAQQNFDKTRAANPDQYHFGSRVPQKYTPSVVIDAQKRLDSARAEYGDAVSKLAEVPDYSDGNTNGLYIASHDGKFSVNDPARQYIYRYSGGRLVESAYQDPGQVTVDTEFEGLMQMVLGAGVGSGALRGIKVLAARWGARKAAKAAAEEVADDLAEAVANRAAESEWRLKGWSGRKGYEIKIPRGTNSPTTIGGRYFTGHALDQMQGRGIPPTVVEHIVQSVKPIVGNKPGSLLYQDLENGISVVTNTDGDIVTVGYGIFKGAG